MQGILQNGSYVFTINWKGEHLLEDDGNLYHTWQTAPDGAWSPWLSHGHPPSTTVSGSLEVAPNADGRLELFITGNDGNLYHIWQTAPNGTWSSWLSHGQPSSSTQFGFPTLALNSDGRLELFISGEDGNLYQLSQTTPGGTWSGWSSFGQPPSGASLFPVVISDAQGRLDLFVVGNDANLYRSWQTAPGGSWSNWSSLSHPPSTSISGPPAIALNADRGLELFMLGVDNNLYHIWQTTPIGAWSNWSSLGSP